MKQGVTTFLMFVGDQHGKAEEAMKFYISLFPNSGIDYIERYGAGDKKSEGTVKVAMFTINGRSSWPRTAAHRINLRLRLLLRFISNARRWTK
jgi:predicted 3-demethylubiquinone-9 3-methyltransferase (glyoxalase superfamily)